MKTFFDSSAFAKRYVEESGSPTVDLLCQNSTELALSVLCIPEIISALMRRSREGNLSHREYADAKQYFSQDIRDAIIINIVPQVLSKCTKILEDNPVRAADALHIACALEWKAELFVSADKRQISAAKKSGLHTKLV
ncbi:MAG: type II toxin-antitoxin system VapC family toxin [Candidatus Schekmanbacteria bacterium]|nr:type II toxin-antitoxin system VapC family toxin [Candidatus Schekmanbacteria bacterium]